MKAPSAHFHDFPALTKHTAYARDEKSIRTAMNLSNLLREFYNAHEQNEVN